VPTPKKVPPAVREIRIAVGDQKFDEIVEILRKVWVVPELPGLRGCDPCRSGLDRVIIEDPLLRQIGQR
jgi:hypothetical protein